RSTSVRRYNRWTGAIGSSVQIGSIPSTERCTSMKEIIASAGERTLSGWSNRDRRSRNIQLAPTVGPDPTEDGSMSNTTPREGKPGTTDQWPRWEGPEETRPRGYLPANDDPATDRDAAGENLNDPDRRTLGDA